MEKASEVGLKKKIKVVVGEEGENGGGEAEVAIGEEEERIGEEEAMIEDEMREDGEEVLLSGLVLHFHFQKTPFLFSQQERLNIEAISISGEE